MLKDRVKCAVANPGGPIGVGSTVTLGAASTGYTSFLTAFGGAKPAYFVLSDGAGRTLTGVWTVNAATPETATITEILWNDRLQSTAAETFSSACVAWNAYPAVEVPLIRNGPVAGLRNLIINGNPTINQRSYASGAATSIANQYTLDRWRVVTSGQNLSYSDSAGIRTVTAPAGGAEQVIESLSILAGIYTLSWVGTATATVNGATVANGGQVTLPGNTNATVRLTGGTFSLVQLEPGPLKTLFEMRPIGLEIILCQRYYWRLSVVMDWSTNAPGAGHGAFFPVFFPAMMRVAPTVVLSATGGVNVTVSVGTVSQNHCQFNGLSSAGGLMFYQLTTATTFTAEL